mmetsp:Transcript_56299/g.131933  ORF Transcript_56299/g.131933 Transcript_56299/m.131933 type:complete len:287 (-) Transcript_56299:808-1668(-)
MLPAVLWLPWYTNAQVDLGFRVQVQDLEACFVAELLEVLHLHICDHLLRDEIHRKASSTILNAAESCSVYRCLRRDALQHRANLLHVAWLIACRAHLQDPMLLHIILIILWRPLALQSGDICPIEAEQVQDDAQILEYGLIEVDDGAEGLKHHESICGFHSLQGLTHDDDVSVLDAFPLCHQLQDVCLRQIHICNTACVLPREDTVSNLELLADGIIDAKLPLHMISDLLHSSLRQDGEREAHSLQRGAHQTGPGSELELLNDSVHSLLAGPFQHCYLVLHLQAAL